MSVTVTTRYWLTNGDTSKPYEETKKVRDSDLVVLSWSNEPDEINDTEITQVQFDTYVAANEAAAATPDTSYWTNRNAQIASATPKLLGLGLTQAEIDALFNM